MRTGFFLAILFLIGSISGCLGSGEPDYSDFEGCTGEEGLEEECAIDTGEENITANDTSIDTNGTAVDIGTYENQTLPLIEGLARPMNGEWSNWSSDTLFNQSDKWVLIQFAATDCGHCWNGAELMSELHENYSNNVTFVTFIINFTWSNSSLEEIAAFQDEANFSGCNQDRNNCNQRPGSPHNWTYFDDRNLYWLSEFHMTGTPAYVLVQPDGVVGWHQKQRNESIQDAMANLFTATGA
jgi:thiol-disulfide isomerase/thioredoxin